MALLVIIQHVLLYGPDADNSVDDIIGINDKPQHKIWYLNILHCNSANDVLVVILIPVPVTLVYEEWLIAAVHKNDEKPKNIENDDVMVHRCLFSHI